ncbi:unnamed protein product [Phytomonas sp. Hart1]|nr:unnamed protein product [Phytomonas sp. Hart1]|eukprot:CCW71423.1 unnamed protein product [Phytomonas sp. isolate Hart1]
MSPLLATDFRPMDEINNDVRRTFPVIFHAAGHGVGLTKLGKLGNGALGAQWLVPMPKNPNLERKTMEYLASILFFDQ